MNPRCDDCDLSEHCVFLQDRTPLSRAYIEALLRSSSPLWEAPLMSCVQQHVIPEIKIAEHLPPLPNVYVCYAWSEVYASWGLLGFVRVRRARIRVCDFATYRARFLIPEGIPFQMQELFCAAALGVGDSPRAVLRKALRKMRARDIAERSKLIYHARRRTGVVRRPAATSSTRTGRSN